MGKSNPIMNMLKIVSRPLKLILANTYAAELALKVASTTVPTMTTTLFRSCRQKEPKPMTYW